MSADLSVSVDEFHEREVVCEIKQMGSSGSVCSWAAKCAATDVQWSLTAAHSLLQNLLWGTVVVRKETKSDSLLIH